MQLGVKLPLQSFRNGSFPCITFERESLRVSVAQSRVELARNLSASTQGSDYIVCNSEMEDNVYVFQ